MSSIKDKEGPSSKEAASSKETSEAKKAATTSNEKQEQFRKRLATEQKDQEEQLKCEREHLPDSIKGFTYASCLRFDHNQSKQPNVTVNCECHPNRMTKCEVFKELNSFFKNRVEEYKIDTAEMEKWFRLCHDVNPFDCGDIRQLSRNWSCILYYRYKTRCVSVQSCFGHSTGINKYPWIKFACLEHATLEDEIEDRRQRVKAKGLQVLK